MGTQYDGTERERTALDAFIKLMRAAESVGADMTEHLDAWDLTSTQFGILEAVWHLGPMHQKEIGKKLLKSGGNISIVVDNLEGRGLVRRERMESDRRYVKIHLTDDGKALISELMPDHVDVIAERLSVLEPDEQKQLAELCKRLGIGREAE